MKLICTQENFKKAISLSERVTSKKNTLPILNNILFETYRSGLKLSATNLEIGLSFKIGAKIEKEGKITIPARLISDFANNLPPNSNISIETEGESLKIKSGPSKSLIRGLSAADFPLIPSKKGEYLFEIKKGDFKKILTKTLPSVAINETRPELAGVNLRLKEREISFAATDSFRLAEYSLKLEEKSLNEDNYRVFIEKNDNLIIPSPALIELNRLISPGEEGVVKIAIEEGQIFFEVDGVNLVSRLINGKYPAYEHILPKSYKTSIYVDKNDLSGAIKMATVFSPKGSREISLKIDSESKKIFITAKSAEAGENITEVKIEPSGPSQEVIFNSRYILEGIGVTDSSRVAILLNNESSPVAIKEVFEGKNELRKEFVYIVMPIKN